MSFQLVKADVKYAEGFRAVLDAVCKERKYLSQLEAKPIEQIREFVATNCEKNLAQYFAIENSEVIGWGDVLPCDHYSRDHVGMLGMGVHSDHRGKGVGEALLRKVIEHARTTGLRKIELEVIADNLRAQSLYRKLGFMEEGRKRMGRKLEGRMLDMIHMGYIL